MRHGNNKRKFGREKNERAALLKSLALNLIVREKIKTTLPKAKELRPFIEKLVTRAKKGDLATRRQIIAKLTNRSKETKKLFEVIAPKYKGISGGYTRVLKLGARKSDGAPMAIIEFV
ncbi:MAG: 50S ribosomal protein L17 [Candidatus Pacebacteria bacterium]|jgi:large subunit ribosomal protein L17|nr:50S ribosomal protein L17 [Candidatus Paceibacterota bacterium]